MKIIRDGVEIELTEQEIEAVYREKERYYTALDLVHKAEEHDVKLSMDDAYDLVEAALDIFSDVGAGENYWGSIEDALRESGYIE